MDGIDHVLLTRFNLPSLGAESIVRAQDGWLADRSELFERWCLPSVRSQSSKKFQWIIYFDPQSPTWLLDRIRDSWGPGTFTPFFREEVSQNELLADIRAITGAQGATLLTTNIDNDDALATDFVDRVQAAAPREARAAIFLVNGLITRDGDVYRHRDRHNAFCSVTEPWAGAKTCWLDWHVSLGNHMPVIEVGGAPAWLQVVHGKNVSNRVRGMLVSPDPFHDRFAGALDEARVPSRSRVIRDRTMVVPLRAMNEAARSVSKSVVLTLFGRSGLDRIKRRLARLRQPV